MTPRGRRLRIRWRSRAGFTLVELLIALVLFGFLSLALFGSVRANTNAWIRATAHADESDHNLHAQDLLRYLIENAYPFFLPGDVGNRHIDFTGSDKRLSFLSAAPIALGNGGRSRINLEVEPRDRDVDLMLDSRPELSTGAEPAKEARKPLLNGASSIAFSYFGKLPADRVAQWHDDWTAQAELPRLVRIAVRVGPGDWPDLVAAPRITADVGCVPNSFTMRCEGR
jgi:prepilin-type N-terminal cleavage/methylation domain-containing protein